MSHNILVTGATGFIGGRLVKGLLQKGHQVIILKRSFSRIDRIRDLLPHLYSYDIDRCDLVQPFREFEKIDAIIHLATSYGRNQESLSDIVDVNTLFPLRLLEAASHFQVNCFLNTDTYFNKLPFPYQGLEGYSLSKRHFREWGAQFARLQKIHFVNISLEHVFGPGDGDSKFVPFLIRHLLKNAAPLDLTPGEQKRDFIYIEDVVSAFLYILNHAICCPTSYQEYEVGTGQSVSLRTFIGTAHKLSHSITPLNFGTIPYREQEIMDSVANIEQLVSLEWSPQYTLERALSLTIAHYASQTDRED